MKSKASSLKKNQENGDYEPQGRFKLLKSETNQDMLWIPHK